MLGAIATLWTSTGAENGPLGYPIAERVHDRRRSVRHLRERLDLLVAGHRRAGAAGADPDAAGWPRRRRPARWDTRRTACRRRRTRRASTRSSSTARSTGRRPPVRGRCCGPIRDALARDRRESPGCWAIRRRAWRPPPTAPGSTRPFQHGSIYWSPATGARAMLGPDPGPLWIAVRRRPPGPLGYPTRSVSRAADGAGAVRRLRSTARSTGRRRPAPGRCAVRSGTAWVAAGAESGWLGYPTSTSSTAADGRGPVRAFPERVDLRSSAGAARSSPGGSAPCGSPPGPTVARSGRRRPAMRIWPTGSGRPRRSRTGRSTGRRPRVRGRCRGRSRRCGGPRGRTGAPGLSDLERVGGGRTARVSTPRSSTAVGRTGRRPREPRVVNGPVQVNVGGGGFGAGRAGLSRMQRRGGDGGRDEGQYAPVPARVDLLVARDRRAGDAGPDRDALEGHRRRSESLLGYPTQSVSNLPGGGQYARFQHGSIYWTAATGARAMLGPIETFWKAIGAERACWAIRRRACRTLPGGGQYARFQHGSIYWSAATGTRAMLGAVQTRWLRRRRPSAGGWAIRRRAWRRRPTRGPVREVPGRVDLLVAGHRGAGGAGGVPDRLGGHGLRARARWAIRSVSPTRSPAGSGRSSSTATSRTPRRPAGLGGPPVTTRAGTCTGPGWARAARRRAAGSVGGMIGTAAPAARSWRRAVDDLVGGLEPARTVGASGLAGHPPALPPVHPRPDLDHDQHGRHGRRAGRPLRGPVRQRPLRAAALRPGRLHRLGVHQRVHRRGLRGLHRERGPDPAPARAAVGARLPAAVAADPVLRATT